MFCCCCFFLNLNYLVKKTCVTCVISLMIIPILYMLLQLPCVLYVTSPNSGNSYLYNIVTISIIEVFGQTYCYI